MSTNFEEMAKRWWVNAATPELTKRVRNKKIVDALYNAADMLGVDKAGLDKYLKQTLPRKSKNDPNNVAYFGNSYKYDHDRLTPISCGRFFKTIFPEASDVMTEAFTLFWRDNISFDISDYKLVIGNTREDFKEAFTNHNRTSSVNYDYYKSISDSCMRYSFDSLAAHPSEVYASGDFEVVTIKSKRGKTKARCVVRIKAEDGSPCYSHGMIYACDNHSGGLIKEYLDSKGGRKMHQTCEWHGANLLKIEDSPVDGYNTQFFICPYIDNARYILLSADYLKVVSDEYVDLNDKRYVSNSTSGGVCFNMKSDRDRYELVEKKVREFVFVDNRVVGQWIS